MPEATENPWELKSMAERALDEGDLDTAAELLRQLQATRPTADSPLGNELAHLLQRLANEAGEEFVLPAAPVIKVNVEQLRDDARRAFRSDEYDRARDLFAQIVAATDNTDLHDEAERYLRHLEPDNLALLGQLPGKPPDERIALLEEALERGLEFDLEDMGKPLDDLLAKAQDEQQAAADNEARQLLAAGRKWVTEGGWVAARDAYESARELPAMSEEIRSQVEARLADLDRQEQVMADIDRRLAVAWAYIQADKPDIRAAEKDLDKANALYEQDSDLPGRVRLAELRQAISNAHARQIGVDRILAEADEVVASDPWYAADLYKKALDAAREARLAALENRARQGKDRAEETIDQLRAETEQAQIEGQQALEAGDYEAAIAHFQAARSALPEAQVPTELVEQLAAAQQALELAEAREAAQRQISERNYELAIDLIDKALQLAPGDEDLTHFRTMATEGLEFQSTMRQTLGERQVDERSPNEARSMLELIGQEFRGQEATDSQLQYEALYRLQVVSDLHVRLDEVAGAIADGRLREATTTAEEAYEEWKAYLDEEQKLGRPNPTLKARLAILREQISDLREAQRLTDELVAQLAPITEVSETGDDEQAVALGRKAAGDLKTVPPRLDYVTGRVRSLLGEALAPPLRRHARAIYDEATPEMATIEARLSQDQPGEADLLLGAIRPRLDELQELKKLYGALGSLDDGADWVAGWTTPTLQPEWEELRTRTDDELRWRSWLDEADAQAEAGKFSEALSLVDKVLAQNQDYTAAKVRRGQFSEAAGHRHAVEAALAADPPDHEAALKQLSTLTIVAGVSAWATQQLAEVRRRRDQYNAAEQSLAVAKSALAKGWYDSAQRSAQAVLDRDRYPDLPVNKRDDAERIVEQATQTALRKEEVERWKAEAQETVRQGQFDIALELIDRIDASNNAAMNRLREQAGKGLTMLEAAQTALSEQNLDGYTRAEQTLREVLFFAYDSEPIKQLLKQAQDGRAATQGPEASLREAKAALDKKEWRLALEIALAALPGAEGLSRIEPQLVNVRDAAASELRQQLQTVVANHTATQEELDWARETEKLLDQNNLLDRQTEALRPRLELSLTLAKARSLLRSLSIVEAVNLLQPLAKEHGSDESFASVFATARFAEHLQAARSSLRPEPATEQQLEQALEELAQANQLRMRAERPGEWEQFAGLGEGETSQTWESDLKKRQALLLTRKAINAGRLQEAKDKLATLPRSDNAVAERLTEIAAIEELMVKANAWEQGSEALVASSEALAALRPPNRNPAYDPATQLHEKIVELLNGRAEIAAAGERVENLAEAIQLYDDLLQFDQANHEAQTRRRELESQLRTVLTQLSTRVEVALGDHNLSYDKCGELLNEVRLIPQKWLDQYQRLKSAPEALENRLGQIESAEAMVERARGELKTAHTTGQYDRVLQTLTTAEEFNQSIFGSRNSIVNLRYEVNAHRAKRDRIAQTLKPRYELVKKIVEFNYSSLSGEVTDGLWLDAYRKNLSRFGQGRPEHEPPLPEDLISKTDEVENYVAWGLGWLAEALYFNAQWSEADRKNLYGLREWSADQEVDPLTTEYETFKAKQENLRRRLNQAAGGERSGIIGALVNQMEAQKLSAQAEGSAENAASAADYQQAEEIFGEAEKLYTGALEMLEALPEGNNRWAQVLDQRSKALHEQLETEKGAARKRKAQATKRRIEVEEAVQAAYSAQRECGDHDIRCWENAITQWKIVRDEKLPKANHEAQRKISELENRIATEKARIRRRNHLMLIGGGIGAILLVLLFVSQAGLFAVAPLPTETPTPTITLTSTPSITPLPTATSTAIPTETTTPAPTATPTMTPLPPTDTPVPPPSPTPRTCEVKDDSWIRAEPTSDSIGLQTVDRGIRLRILDRVENEEGEDWYLIEDGFGQQGYIWVPYTECP